VLSIPFERHTLKNGLRVILAPDRSVPVVALNLWYGVGSRNERKGRTGFAHLFEHMMFQGSAHVPKNLHFELVERAGGSLNATTWFDRTNYFETLPSHHLELALWLESDRMGWLLPAMTAEKLQNQQDVVRNEKRQVYDSRPYGDWDERMQALVFPEDHPYRHKVIGSMEDIAAASLDDVRDFFETFYIPNNAVLTLAGDLDPDSALALVERHFGPIPAGAPPPPIPGRIDPGDRLGTTVREEARGAVPLPRVYIGSRIPPFTDDDFYVADVATSVLSGGRASRMYERLVRGRRVAKDAAAYAFPLVTGRSYLVSIVTGYPESDPALLEEAVRRGGRGARGGECGRSRSGAGAHRNPLSPAARAVRQPGRPAVHVRAALRRRRPSQSRARSTALGDTRRDPRVRSVAPRSGQPGGPHLSAGGRVLMASHPTRSVPPAGTRPDPPRSTCRLSKAIPSRTG
jgi:zinc protease